MIGLMLKDFFSLRSYLRKQALLMLVIYAFIGFSTRSFTLLPPMITMSVVMMIISSFSVDDAAHWNSYALTLPLETKDLVRAKYVLVGGALILTAGISAALAALLDSFTFRQGAVPIFASAAGLCILYLLVCAVTLPLFFKFGAEKARIYMTLTLMLPFFLVIFGAQWLTSRGVPMPTETQITVLALGTFAVCVIAYLISYFISVGICEAKEY